MSLGPLTPAYEHINALCLTHGEALARRGVPLRVAFDCDKTLIAGDIGEASFARLLSQGRVLSCDEWWAALPAREVSALRPAYEREAARVAVERARGGEPEPLNAALFDDLWRAYESLCAREIREGYLFAARCCTGYALSEARALADEMVEEALASPVTAGRGPSLGVRPRPAMRALVSALEGRGVEVWVVSSSQDLLVERLVTRELGVRGERVIGVGFELDARGALSSRPVEPCPIDEGKRARFLASLGEPPLVMVGDSRYDLPLMRASAGGVFVDHGRAELRAQAEALGAVVVLAQELDNVRSKDL